MVTIYQDYGDEPKDTFLSIPEELACAFYALEMDGFTEDIDFFAPLLPEQGAILELGCGTGRIARKIANPGRFIIGIDISTTMLRLAGQKSHPAKYSPGYVCMDMRRLAFSIYFAAILIPYNTLNLLGSEDKIIQCLACCRKYLQQDGKLLVQLFIPTEEFIQRKKTFQFQMFDNPKGGKIIKEILKQYEPQSQSVLIEERFRVRPQEGGPAKEDWHSTFTVAGFSADRWFALFNQAGFTPTNISGDYGGGPYQPLTSSTLLLTLALQ